MPARRLSTAHPLLFSITYLLVWTATKSTTQDLPLVSLALGLGHGHHRAVLLRRCRDEFLFADRAWAYEPLRLGAGGGNRLGRHVYGESVA